MDEGTLVTDLSSDEGGRFGVLADEDGQNENNPVVLTALEDGVRHGRQETIRNLEGVFRLNHPDMSGSLSVMPGASTGTSRFGLCMRSIDSAEGVRLHAEVRSTWITITCNRYQEAAGKAVALVEALVRLASIPGQQTVSVRGDDDTLTVPRSWRPMSRCSAPWRNASHRQKKRTFRSRLTKHRARLRRHRSAGESACARPSALLTGRGVEPNGPRSQRRTRTAEECRPRVP